MSNHMNNALPIEILEKIFQYIIDTGWGGKKDINICVFGLNSEIYRKGIFVK